MAVFLFLCHVLIKLQRGIRALIKAIFHQIVFFMVQMWFNEMMIYYSAG